eukprot:3825376-Rhodomonas_salina.2
MLFTPVRPSEVRSDSAAAALLHLPCFARSRAPWSNVQTQERRVACGKSSLCCCHDGLRSCSSGSRGKGEPRVNCRQR